MPRVLIKPRWWLWQTVVGLGFIGVFAYSVASFVSFQRQAVHTAGTVVSVQKEAHAAGRRGGKVTVTRPQVKFSVAGSGQEITALAKVMTRRNFTVGDKVEVAFLARDPAATVRVDSGLSLVEIAFGVVGAALMFFGLSARWQYQRALAVQVQAAKGRLAL